MIKLILLLFLLKKCSGFDLDDVEYEKMPPLFALDDYDRCLLYNGTYCVIRTDLSAEPGNELMTMIKNYTKSSRVKHYDHSYLNKGICVTSTCRDHIGYKDVNSQSDIQDILDACENQTIYDKYGLQAKVTKIFYCDTAETKVDKKDLLDWIVLGVIALIVFINVAAIMYDSTLDEKKVANLSFGMKMLLCFSMARNWKYLVAPPNEDPKMNKLQGIDFVRTAASFMMVLGHVNWIYTMGFVDNPHDFERSYNLMHFQVIYNGMIVVQIFFVISGFLLVYNLESSEKNRPSVKDMPKIIINRFCRLAPPMAVVIALNATWARFLSTGPLWKLYVSSMVHDCRKWWWSHLLFVNNYLIENKYCTVQTWHTAADTQVFLVAILLYFLVKPRARTLVVGLVFLIGMILPMLHIYFQDLDAQMLKTPEMLRSLDDPNRYPYVFSHNNICCYLLGMVTAYKLYRWEKQGVIFNGKIARIWSKMLVPVMILCFLTGNFFHEEDYRTPLWIRMLWQGTHRLFLGFPMASLLVSMVMGVDNLIQDIMKWPVFKITGKLTYSVFLLHETFTPLIAGSKSNLEHFAYFNLLIYQCGIVVLTYILSVPFYLMVEASVTQLVRLLLVKERPVLSPADPDHTKKNVEYNRKADKIEENGSIILNGNELNDNVLNELLDKAVREETKKTS